MYRKWGYHNSFVLGRKHRRDGRSFREVCRWLKKLAKVRHHYATNFALLKSYIHGYLRG